MTPHARALATLRGWQPPSAGQVVLRDRFVAHLVARPDGLERACFPDHLTAGTIVLSSDLSSVLLNLHRKAGQWFAFGGHHEPGDESLAATALREATEESGIATLAFDPEPLHLDLHEVQFCDPRGTVHHLDVRYGAVDAGGSRPRVSSESLDVRWWPLDALPDLEQEMQDLIGLARARSQASPASAVSALSAAPARSSDVAASGSSRAPAE